MSALVWGDAPAELVLVHGSAQNAHTFDTVALALDRPLVAVDLPHHGHSDASFYGPRALDEHAERPRARPSATLSAAPRSRFVAMSYGGLVSVALPHEHPELATRLVLVDITPGVNARHARHILRLHRRTRVVRQFRRDPRTHRRLQPGSTRRRRFAAASCTTPSSAPTARGYGATNATGAARTPNPSGPVAVARGPGRRSRWCARWVLHRSSPTTTSRSSDDVDPTTTSLKSPARAIRSRVRIPWNWPRSSPRRLVARPRNHLERSHRCCDRMCRATLVQSRVR